MLLSSPPLPRVYLGREREWRGLHGRMLNNNQFVAQIRPEPLLLHLLLPVPNLFVVHHSHTMESNRTRGSHAFLCVTGVIYRLQLS